MKRYIIATVMILCIGLLTTAALAEPAETPENSPNGTSTNSGELIAYNSKGETVVRIQLRLRELGYLNYKPTGNFQNMTVQATKRFQQKQTDDNGNPIMADGTIGEQSMRYLFLHRATQEDIFGSIPIGKALSGTPELTGEIVNWDEVSGLIQEGSIYVIHDYNTSVQWKMRCTGGTNHAEMECYTAEDGEIYRKAFGDEFNYSKRPVVVEVGGRYIAASLQGYPHGEDNIPGNGMEGHACLYFNGSLSHVGSWPDVEHQAQVFKAAGR